MIKIRTILIALFFVCIFSPQAWTQSIVGSWKTIDDITGKTRSVVRIFEQNGKYFGKIEKLFLEPNEDQDPLCTECTGKLNGQKIIGMQIINDMVKSGAEYVDGNILDPENGKTYNCKLWVEDGNLKVRGYVMFLYRTQTWLPNKDTSN